jgi:hypothetical protein
MQHVKPKAGQFKGQGKALNSVMTGSPHRCGAKLARWRKILVLAAVKYCITILVIQRRERSR